MNKRTKLTNCSDETEISSLISGDSVFAIPYFQRSYKWKGDKLKLLNLDILNIIDASDSHFLGAIIIHGRRSNPTDPKTFDIIDGQQRITTLILYLCAAVKVLCEYEEFTEAAGLLLKYLVIARENRLESNLKLHPCKEDRNQINSVYEDILDCNELNKKLGGFKAKFLPSTGRVKGAIRNNYRSALRFLREQVKAEGVDRLLNIYTAILESISVVQIDIWDPTSGPKIFDSLNSRHQPMTIGDLVRNEIFSKVSHEEVKTIEQIDEESWQPFYKKFQQGNKNLFEDYFFPFGLIQDSNLTKQEVYGHLRESWGHLDSPESIIEKLRVFQNAFIDLICGTNLQAHEKKGSAQLKRLTNLGPPKATYPFLMQISNAIKDKNVNPSDGLETLNVVESFLVRRAICGHEPTGLHAVFKKLWNDCKGQPTASSVTRSIQKHKTVSWPDNNAFRIAIATRPLYGSAITPYFLQQYDCSLKGDQPEIKPWIEHVLPEKKSDEWKKAFSQAEHESLKDVLANLIPLTDEMNRALGNKGYADKREKYRGSSFKSTREFANSYSRWTPATINQRSKLLQDWALKRWSS
jgi:hypothetical protein